MFIGYCKETKGYRIIILDTGKVIVSKDVKFVENEIWQWCRNEVTVQKIILKERKEPAVEIVRNITTLQSNSAGNESSSKNVEIGRIGSSSPENSLLRHAEQRPEFGVDESPIQKGENSQRNLWKL